MNSNGLHDSPNRSIQEAVKAMNYTVSTHQNGTGGQSSHYNSATVNSSYQHWASTYDNDIVSLGWNPLQTIRPLVLKHVHHATPKGLDVGCGTGLICKDFRLHSYSTEFDGFDFSSAMLEVAKKKGIYKNLIEHSLLCMPWPYADDCYDVLICNGVLRYTTEGGGKILREMVRVCKPGAILLLHCPDLNWSMYAPEAEAMQKEQLWQWCDESAPVSLFTCKELGNDGNQEDSNGLFRIRVYRALKNKEVQKKINACLQ